MKESEVGENTYLTLEEEDVVQLKNTPQTVDIVIKNYNGKKYFLKMNKKTFLYFYEKLKKLRRKLKFK